MTTSDPPAGSPAAAMAAPGALLAALRANAGSLVDGASLGSPADAPAVEGLSAARADAVLAAWTGARLHAGESGLLRVSGADLGLLVGDWCFAHALQALAQGGDLEAIGLLAAAIGDCAVLLTQDPVAPERLAAIWQATSDALRAES